ncbi:ThiF family adenylyltransferase [Methylobacterium radiotolerans]
MSWLENWGTEIEVRQLRLPAARSTAEYISAHAVNIATLVGARRNDLGAEILVLDFRTGVPQRSVVELGRVEPVGIVFADEGAAPFVMMFREDFPDTEHQMLVPDGCPAAICLDDRPWVEAKLTWTPGELVQRILMWFHRAARGELHDPAQPLDPFFGYSKYKFILPTSVLTGAAGVELVGSINESEDPEIITVLPVSVIPKEIKIGRILPIAYSVKPEKMRRLRRAPQDFMAISAMLAERDIDLVADLRKLIVEWAGAGAEDRPKMTGNLAIIVAMPVIGPDGTQPGMVDVRAFLTTATVGELGVALGVLLPDEGSTAASGFARALMKQDIDQAALAECRVELAQVHVAFEPEQAAILAGRPTRDTRKAVMIGAGAVGSHVAEYLVREGRFAWTLVDDDRLLPHNLARHTLRTQQVGLRKVNALKDRLNSIFSPVGDRVVSAAIGCNVLRPGSHRDELQAALADAEIIIDATASVAASRHLADLGGAGRRVSVFFNPSAEAAVVLVESADRAVGLRDLEAQYYRAVLQRPELERHLTAIGERFAYTGACRDVTNRVPESRIALLSALAAQGMSFALDRPEPYIGIWSLNEDGGVTATKPDVAAVERRALLDWEVTFDKDVEVAMVAMRDARLPSETGGSVIGIADAVARKIHLVEALPPPPDSVGSVSQFERGISGLDEAVDAKAARAMHQVRYVGEWHSHPPRHPTTPSPTDLVQLGVTTMDQSIDEMPAISVILGDGGVNVLLGDTRRAC